MKSISSKIMLFGEYSLILGSKGLAVPLRKYRGTLGYEDKEDNRWFPFLEHLKKHKDSISFDLDIEQLECDVKNGLSFDSNIPVGYGLGSSGVLVSLVVEKYGRKKVDNLRRIKEALALMECAFHGESSGLDPFVSFLNKPFLFDGDNIVTANLIKTDSNWFLIDTGMNRSNSFSVSANLEKIRKDIPREILIKNWYKPVDLAIEKLLSADKFGTELKVISQFQFEYLKWLIPPKLYAIWKEGLNTNDFYLKLCGAGGGGFILGYGDITKIENELKTIKISIPT